MYDSKIKLGEQFLLNKNIVCCLLLALSLPFMLEKVFSLGIPFLDPQDQQFSQWGFLLFASNLKIKARL